MFDKSFRTITAMQFERSIVDEVSGKLPDGRNWSITIRRPNLFRDETYYDGYIAGAYSADFSGDTLDEAFDAMEAWLADEAEVKAMIRKAVSA